MKIKEICRKHKKKVIVTAVSLAAALLAGAGVTIYCLRKNSEGGLPFMQGGMSTGGMSIDDKSLNGGIVTSYGITGVGMTQESFEVEGLETGLLVEEVYVSSDAEVSQGDAVLKLSEDSVEEARRELESKLREADLAWRTGVITCEQSKITALYEREAAVLDGKQAREVFNDTAASLETAVEQAETALEEAEEKIAQYQAAVDGDTFYEDYQVARYKELYEENLKLLTDKMAEWGVGWSQVAGTGSAAVGSVQGVSSAVGSGQGVSSAGGSGQDILSAGGSGQDVLSAGDSGQDVSSAGGSGQGVSSAGGSGQDVSSAENSGQSGASGSAFTLSKAVEDGSVQNGSDLRLLAADDTSQENILSLSSVSGGDGTAASGNNSYVSILKNLYSILEQNLKDYEQAQSDYEDARTNTAFELQTLELKLPSLQTALAEARENYETKMLEAKLTCETSLASAERAEADYETAVQKAEAQLEELKDQREDARQNLELFENSVGDCLYHAGGSGTVMRSMLRSGQYLTSGGGIFVYSNPDDISVTASVDQSDVSRISVGDTAYVESSGYGSFRGTVTEINPVSSSDSRTSVTYQVTVTVPGEAGSLPPNQTVTVIFGVGGAADE